MMVAPVPAHSSGQVDHAALAARDINDHEDITPADAEDLAEVSAERVAKMPDPRAHLIQIQGKVRC
jgi:hypothetical protein